MNDTFSELFSMAIPYEDDVKQETVLDENEEIYLKFEAVGSGNPLFSIKIDKNSRLSDLHKIIEEKAKNNKFLSNYTLKYRLFNEHGGPELKEKDEYFPKTLGEFGLKNRNTITYFNQGKKKINYEDTLNNLDKIEDLDKRFLTELFCKTDGNNWLHNTNWLSDKPINKWYGIKTFNDYELHRLKDPLSKIKSICLKNNRLKGEIPKSIELLRNLQYFRISGNNFSFVSKKIFSLKNLRILAIEGIQSLAFEEFRKEDYCLDKYVQIVPPREYMFDDFVISSDDEN